MNILMERYCDRMSEGLIELLPYLLENAKLWSIIGSILKNRVTGGEKALSLRYMWFIYMLLECYLCYLSTFVCQNLS